MGALFPWGIRLHLAITLVLFMQISESFILRKICFYLKIRRINFNLTILYCVPKFCIGLHSDKPPITWIYDSVELSFFQLKEVLIFATVSMNSLYHCSQIQRIQVLVIGLRGHLVRLRVMEHGFVHDNVLIIAKVITNNLKNAEVMFVQVKIFLELIKLIKLN